MEKAKTDTVVLAPQGTAWFPVAEALLAIAFISVIFAGESSFGDIPGGFIRVQGFLLAGILISALAIFFLVDSCNIVIQASTISFPETNDRGFPKLFFLAKTIVDISAIRRIIKYPALLDGTRIVNQNGDDVYVGEYRRISITYLQAKTSICLSGEFWGSELLDELIEEILERNENVQIIDQDRLFKEDKH